jgi:hypothetical protein
MSTTEVLDSDLENDLMNCTIQSGSSASANFKHGIFSVFLYDSSKKIFNYICFISRGQWRKGGYSPLRNPKNEKISLLVPLMILPNKI